MAVWSACLCKEPLEEGKEKRNYRETRENEKPRGGGGWLGAITKQRASLRLLLLLLPVVRFVCTVYYTLCVRACVRFFSYTFDLCLNPCNSFNLYPHHSSAKELFFLICAYRYCCTWYITGSVKERWDEKILTAGGKMLSLIRTN